MTLNPHGEVDVSMNIESRLAYRPGNSVIVTDIINHLVNYMFNKLKIDYILDITSKSSKVGKQCSTKRHQGQVKLMSATISITDGGQCSRGTFRY